MTQHYTITYHFQPQQGEAITHHIVMDNDTLISEANAPEPPPEWATLQFHPCGGCELKGTPYCPVALRLLEPLKKFKTATSHHKTRVTVTTPERIYQKDTDMQDGIRSMFGLIMATSGCPTMRPFQPMARFHLPFSTVDETLYRFFSMYLMHRFFLSDTPHSLSYDLSEIEALYAGAQRVNKGMFDRIRQIAEKDGTLNAVVILDSLATIVPFYIEEKIDILRKLFRGSGDNLASSCTPTANSARTPYSTPRT